VLFQDQSRQFIRTHGKDRLAHKIVDAADCTNKQELRVGVAKALEYVKCANENRAIVTNSKKKTEPSVESAGRKQGKKVDW
jgi:hypothetical protein